MAAFCGIVDFERRLVDIGDLERAAAEFPARAFGDATVVSGDHFAFAMRPLRAEFDPPVFEQVVDDGRWVVAGDTRIDARDDLVRHLGDPSLTTRSGDAELLLAAIARWNTSFAEHLTGDFAIAAWDRRERRLLLARDHFGTRPLYFARTGTRIAFATSTLALRQLVHPSPALDRASLADFIVLGDLKRVGATFFEGLHALPPAHVATVVAGGFSSSRYWELPLTTDHVKSGREEIREELLRLLRLAVRDRLRSARVSLQLSGGLDSTALAVLLVEELAPAGGVLSGLTMSHEGIFEDDEPRLAKSVAASGGFPVAEVRAVDWKVWQGMSDPAGLIRERPSHGPLTAAWLEIFRIHGELGGVAMSGDGGDYVMAVERQPYRWWWRTRQPAKIAAAVMHAIAAGIRVRTGLHARKPIVIPAPAIPEWLDPDLLRESEIAERVRDELIDERPGEGLPRPRMRAHVAQRSGDREFEIWHPSVTGEPFVYTLPWFDRRLIEAALAWVAYPWLERKFILRDAMAGRLPREVLTRPKTGLAREPLRAMIDAGLWTDPGVVAADLAGICAPDRWLVDPPREDGPIMWQWCRAIEAALWIRSLT